VPDYTAACGSVRDALFHAVARRRVADVPLGAFLSGGIDSAIIATHLAECTPGPIETFAIGFREHDRYDETRYARIMAEHLASRHHELRLTFDDVIDALPGVLDHLGEPFFDSSIIPTAIVSQLARQHVTVSLSGDGGDELFGGYWRYLAHEAAASYCRLPRWMRSRMVDPLIRAAAASKSSGWSNRVRQMRKLLRAVEENHVGRHLRWSTIMDASSTQVLREPAGASRVLAVVAARFEAATGHLPIGDPLNRILAFDVRYGLPGDMLHKVDLASMRHSLEVRVPFLDPHVVAIAESCPSSFKVDRGLRKRLLVDAYRGRIPDEILDREKAGFELPIGEFLRHRLRDLFLDTVTRETVERFEVLDHAGIMRVYDDHCARRGEHADLLFALLSLCWWWQRKAN
jgi:asparagine synthase (glutamine-hydrolysing)